MRGRDTDEQSIIEIFQLYTLSRKFHTLPREGGIDNQDAYLIDCFNTIMQQEAKEQEKESEIQRSKLKSRL